MATGDVTFFDQFLVDEGKKVHNLDADTIKVGLITSTVTPAATDSDPRWGAGGTVNFATNQVTAGGNYATGGPAIPTNSMTLDTGKGKFDGGDIVIAQHASNPTNARWGIIYNDTPAGKNCVGFVDLGAVTNLSLVPFEIQWAATGIGTKDQA